jgi:hypothetical protein
MMSPGGRFVIAYNGEIYNFTAVRQKIVGGRSLRPGIALPFMGCADVSGLARGLVPLMNESSDGVSPPLGRCAACFGKIRVGKSCFLFFQELSLGGK